MNKIQSTFSIGFLFLCFLVGSFCILEHTARKLYAIRSDLHGKIRCFERVSGSVEVIFIGSSHVEKGIDPHWISAVSFNLAYVSQDVYNTYKLIERYLENMPRLRMVILGISFYDLNFDETHESPFFTVEYYQAAGIWPRHLGVDFLANWSVFYVHQADFIRDLISGKKPTEFQHMPAGFQVEIQLAGEALVDNGFRYSSGSMQQSMMSLNGGQRARYHQSYNDAFVQRENTNLLKALTLLLSRKNIRLLLITIPVTTYYKKSYTGNYLGDFYRSVSEFTRMHPDVSYNDYSENHDHPDAEFLNSDHLNFRGAKRFTKRLSRELVH